MMMLRLGVLVRRRNYREFVWGLVTGGAKCGDAFVGLAAHQCPRVERFGLNLVPFTVVSLKTLILSVAHYLAHEVLNTPPFYLFGG